MKIAVLTIGDEILSGFTVNTNTSWIGQELLKSGITVNTQITVSDDKDEIIKYLDLLTNEQFTYIIVTGGLGPTHDDVTPSAFYEYFNSKPLFDEEYWEELTIRFSERNIKIPERNRNQATRPDNGAVMNNPIGSARGLYFKRGKICYFALPGVPSEMKAMMEAEVIPIIKRVINTGIYTKTIKTIGLGESAIAEKMEELIQKYGPNIKLAFLPQLDRVDIRIFSEDIDKLETFKIETAGLLGRIIYGYDDDSLEEALAKLLIAKNMTIATAESCTGGLIAHRLTNVSGSSKYMRGGIVSYDNDIKIEQVGVNKETIIDHGAVSEQTAGEMALGIQQKFGTEIGLGITGIAGPTGGTVEKPVGLVYIGLAVNDTLFVKKYKFLKDRKANKLLSTQTALNLLRLQLLK